MNDMTKPPLPNNNTAVLREFIEKVLGFGPPANYENLFSVLAGAERAPANGLRYGSTNGYAIASINSVNEMEWHRMHANEKGIIFFDVFEDVEKRLRPFLEKEMAKHGYKLHETINQNAAGRLTKVLAETTGFMKYFRDSHMGGAKCFSSFIVRPNLDGSLNWDMAVRIFILAPTAESAYFEITFPQLIHTVSTLITEDQIRQAALSAFSFATVALPMEKMILGKLSILDWSKMLVETLLQQGDAVTAEGFYIGYRAIVEMNIPVIKDSLDLKYAKRLVTWADLSMVQKRVISDTVELARWHIAKFIANNTAAAHE
jgi:hypothetical protein